MYESTDPDERKGFRPRSLPLFLENGIVSRSTLIFCLLYRGVQNPHYLQIQLLRRVPNVEQKSSFT